VLESPAETRVSAFRVAQSGVVAHMSKGRFPCLATITSGPDASSFAAKIHWRHERTIRIVRVFVTPLVDL
jgi:hypothetical protein